MQEKNKQNIQPLDFKLEKNSSEEKQPELKPWSWLDQWLGRPSPHPVGRPSPRPVGRPSPHPVV